MITHVFEEFKGRTLTRAEWLEAIDRIVADYGNKLLDRKAVYEEAGRLSYPDKNGQHRPNPWLYCAGWAVGDIGNGVLYLNRLKPYYNEVMQGLIEAKANWIKTVNREIWIYWMPANIILRSGIKPELHPLWNDISAEWKLCAQICWEEGANSYNGCAAHSYAEQSGIERVSAFGLAGPHYFGPHSYAPLGWIHQQLGNMRILDWHAPLQLPGFTLNRRPEQPRDWRKLRDRIEYVVGTCCTSCSNNVLKRGSASVCCDEKPRNWDGIIDRSFEAMLAEPASNVKKYTVHPRVAAYREVAKLGKLEGRPESPLVARYLRDLPMFAPDISDAERKVIMRESRKTIGFPLDGRFATQLVRDFLPEGTWYKLARGAMRGAEEHVPARAKRTEIS